MSLYNALFGVNPFAKYLLAMLDIDPTTIPRFRDCFLSKDGESIVIHTRTGGGNRADYVVENKALTKAKGYKYDEDSKTDNTYANFYYAIPKQHRKLASAIYQNGGHADPGANWDHLLKELAKGNDKTKA